jgi:hypothetical protein
MGGIERSVKSLETKWGSIKRNVSKFIGMYGYVAMFNVSGNLLDDIFHRSFELYKVKNPKGYGFFPFIVG